MHDHSDKVWLIETLQGRSLFGMDQVVKDVELVESIWQCLCTEVCENSVGSVMIQQLDIGVWKWVTKVGSCKSTQVVQCNVGSTVEGVLETLSRPNILRKVDVGRWCSEDLVDGVVDDVQGVWSRLVESFLFISICMANLNTESGHGCANGDTVR